MTDVEMFKKITTDMADLYAKKNANYGNSFTKLYEDLGPIAGLVPLHNKLDRLTNLIKGGKNDFESVEDTITDLANYAIMLLIEMKKPRDTDPSKTVYNVDYDASAVDYTTLADVTLASTDFTNIAAYLAAENYQYTVDLDDNK